MGFRHRIKNKLPGKPDIVYPAFKTVIFVDGCFWHRCSKHYQAPKARAEFWEKKISENVERDRKNNHLLERQDWLVIRVWEHEIKESIADCVERLVANLIERKTVCLPTNGLLRKQSQSALSIEK